MELYDSKFSRIEYIEELEMIVHIWKIGTVTMLEDDFKSEMKALSEFFKRYKPKRVFVDQREFYFTVLSDLQQWVDVNVNRILLEQGVEKVAFIFSPDILAKITVAQIFGEENSKFLNVRFFEDYGEAKKWIEQ
jgi:hypothetical protein